MVKSSSVLIDACSARGNSAGSGGCPNGGRREETQTEQVASREVEDVVQQRKAKETKAGARGDAVSRAGSKKKPAAFCNSIAQLMGIIIIKQCLRTEHETRSLCGAIFDNDHHDTEHDVVKSMREQTRRYNEGVNRQRARATHWVHLRSAGHPEAGGSGRSGQCSDCDRKLEAARRHEHGHAIMRGSAGSIGRTSPSKLASLWWSTGQAYETPS